MKYTILILVFLLATGCASRGDIFNGATLQPDDLASIYIYRPPEYFEGDAWPKVYVNEEEYSSLKDGRFVHMNLPEGRHTIKIRSGSFVSSWTAKDLDFTVWVQGGQQSFYRFDLHFGDISSAEEYMYVSGRAGLTKIDKETALEEMKPLRSSM